MNVEVKALDSFLHGKNDVVRGESFKVTKPEAEELAKSGLVEMVEEKAIETPRLQDVKMEGAAENKMAEAPANKSRQKKAD